MTKKKYKISSAPVRTNAGLEPIKHGIAFQSTLHNSQVHQPVQLHDKEGVAPGYEGDVFSLLPSGTVPGSSSRPCGMQYSLRHIFRPQPPHGPALVVRHTGMLLNLDRANIF